MLNSSKANINENNFDSELIKMMNIDYQIIVNKTKHGFYLRIPELNLIAKGQDIHSVYQNLKEEKKRLFTKYIEIGAQDLIPFPLKYPSLFRASSIKVFFIKTAIVSVVVTLLVATIGIGIKCAIRHQLVNLENKITTESVENLARRLQNITPERKKRLLDSLYIIVNELRPFSDELRLLLKGSDEPSGH